MGVYLGDYGYDYVTSLTSAIESYTSDQEKKDSYAFVYRGSSLKHAIERFLHFSCVNCPDLISFFDDIKRNRIKAEYVFPEYHVYIIAKYILGQYLGLESNVCIKFKENLFIKDIIKLKYIFQLVVNILARIYKKRNNAASPNAGFFFVKHIKFSRLFKPIMECMENVGFVTLSPIVNKELRSQNIPSNLIVPAIHGLSALNLTNELKYYYWSARMYDRIYSCVVNEKPRFIVLPEGDAPEYEIINQVGKALKVPVICIQNGWSPILNIAFRNMSFDRMCVWGEGFIELFREYNPNQKFVVTGNYMINVSERVENKQHEDADSICFLMQECGEFVSGKSWTNMFELIVMIAGQYPNISILVREHPAVPLTNDEKKRLVEYQNIVLASPDKYTLNSVFQKCVLSVSVYSSTILESIAADVVPVIYNETSLPNYSPDVDSYGAGIEVKNIEDAYNMICKFIEHRDNLNDFYVKIAAFKNKYFNDDNAVDLVVKTLSEFNV